MGFKKFEVGTVFGCFALVNYVDPYFVTATCTTCKREGTYLLHRLSETSCKQCIKLVEQLKPKSKTPGQPVEGVASPLVESLDRFEKAFWRTLTSYCEKCHLPVVGCSSSDPDSGSGVLRRHASDYIAQVEISTHKALEHDRELYSAWCEIVRKHANYSDAQNVPRVWQQTIIEKCAPVYRKLQLDDYRNFNAKKRLTAKDRVAIAKSIGEMKKEIAQAEILGEAA